MVEAIIIIGIIVVVGIFIFPTSNGENGFKNLTSHATREPNCTCKNITRFSMDIDYNCPVHGDWR